MIMTQVNEMVLIARSSAGSMLLKNI